MKYVVLTGASGGMGLAIAKKLTADGYFVFGLDIKETKEEVKNLSFIKTDITSEKSIINAFKEIDNPEEAPHVKKI